MTDHEPNPMTDHEPLMTLFDAAMILDGEWDMTPYEPSADTHIAACQHLIDSGAYKTLPGRVGRACADMVAQGLCTPPNDPEQ